MSVKCFVKGIDVTEKIGENDIRSGSGSCREKKREKVSRIKSGGDNDDAGVDV